MAPLSCGLVPVSRTRIPARPVFSEPSPAAHRRRVVLRARALAVALATIGVAGCASSAPIQWGEVTPLVGELSERATLQLRGDSASVADGPTMAFTPSGPACAGSLRLASDGTGSLYAVWWSPRDDSSAVLLVARRAEGDGETWGAPVVADARDSSALGCGRPAPAIAADGATGYVHLAYFLDSPVDGRGLYGGHSMDRGAYFHGPVPVVFGDRPVHAAVANSGDVVAIAYEDPNSERARVALAVSITAGHIYEHRVEASPSTMRASRPLVDIDGRRIAVAWRAEQWENGARGSRPMVRVAVLADSARGTWTEEGQ